MTTDQGIGAMAGTVLLAFMGAYLRAQLAERRRELDAALGERALMVRTLLGNGGPDRGAIGALTEGVDDVVARLGRVEERLERVPCMAGGALPAVCPAATTPPARVHRPPPTPEAAPSWLGASDGIERRAP